MNPEELQTRLACILAGLVVLTTARELWLWYRSNRRDET